MDKKLTCDDSEDLEKELIINAFKKIGGGGGGGFDKTI